MMVFAVCDDDAGFAGLMTRHLRELFVSLPDEIECYDRTFFSASQVLDYIEHDPIHILFLDIDMPDKSGFELAEILQRRSPSTIIIFVSAYDSYVYDSFKFSPFCFLRKTHLKDELKVIVSAVMEKYLQSNESMIFSTVDGDKNLLIKDIVYLESVKNYFEIHYIGGAVYKCRGTLASIEKVLTSHNFYRIHTAFLINIVNIRMVGANRQGILIDGTPFNVSQRKWKGFQTAYMEYSRKVVILS